MLNFHYKFIPNSIIDEVNSLYSDNFFEVFFTFEYFQESLKSSSKRDNYKAVQKVFFASNKETFQVDHHTFDKLLALIGDKNTFLLYLYLYKLQDRNVVVTSAETLSDALFQNEKATFEQLAHLEECCLLSISGQTLLKITLNRSWLD